MNRDGVIYTQTDSALDRLFVKVYGLIDVGIRLSALVPFLMLYVFTDNMVNTIVYRPSVYYGAIFLELALIFLASNAARKNTPAALSLFLSYSALNGFTLSFIIVVYTQTTVIQAFASLALVFGVMVTIGTFTKKDLSGMAKTLMVVLISITITSLVNIFIGSGTMGYTTSVISVLVFSGLIAYGNQVVKHVYESIGDGVDDGWIISMVLSLYLDFINLFLSLLRISGSDN